MHPEGQRRIIDEGPLGAGGGNPSLELMKRINRFEAWEHGHHVAAFLSRSFVSRQAEDALRALPIEAARKVLSYGPLMSSDRSGELLARIHDAQRAPRNGGASSDAAQRFCEEGKFDRNAEDAFRALSRELQEKVMREGPVHGSKNPSAVLMSRIRKAKGGGRRSRSRRSSSSSRSRSRRR